MARFVYNLLLVVGFPLIYLYLLRRRAKGKEDTARWGERWGVYPPLPKADGRPRLWVHTVSVGEVMAAVSVLKALRAQFPDALIVLTTITHTGQEIARQRPEADAALYFPLDFPWCARRAVAAIRPDALILMEGEIWPNVLVDAHASGAKVVVVNGRISDAKLPRWKRIAWLLGPAIAAIDRFFMQSDEDARRIQAIGADPERVVALGNTKFDESSAPLTEDERAHWRRELGVPDAAPIWVCGSTRESTVGGADEEALVARARLKVLERFPDLVTIVAPRHLERIDAVRAALPGAARRSLGQTGPLLILDTFGELAKVYALARVAFIGGSLVPWGGQSVFQPLAQGVPTVFGPHMNNQRDIAALALREGVGFEVADADALADEVIRLLSLSDVDRAALSARARALIDRNQGVSRRAVEGVAELLRG